MKGIKFFLLALIIASLCFSCATTEMRSIKTAAPGKIYQRVAVVFTAGNWAERAHVEMVFADRWKNSGVTVIPATSFLQPGKKYSDDDLRKIGMENNLDGGLFIYLGGAGKEAVFNPGFATSQGQASGYVNPWYGAFNASASSVAIGPSIGHKIWANCYLAFYDIKIEKPIWTATSSSKAPPIAQADFEELMETLADKTLKELKAAAILQ